MPLTLEGEEIAVVLGLAREGERLTSVIEVIAPNARTGDRKRKVAHILARCEQALDAEREQAERVAPPDHKDVPAIDPVSNPGAHNRAQIAKGIEEAAAAGERNV